MQKRKHRKRILPYLLVSPYLLHLFLFITFPIVFSIVNPGKLRLINGEELYDVKTDQGQANDISADYHETVKYLRNEYDKWWKSVSTRFDEYTRTIVGTEHENPVTLTGHDWSGSGAWSRTLS